MKNYSRAYNRQKQRVKFVRRVKNWFSSTWNNDKEQIEKTLAGEQCNWLRTTGRPCNCYGCTYKKYKRTPKNKRVNLD